jgi:dTDP-4-amino-4,6-dideoxygalactose transaminase
MPAYHHGSEVEALLRAGITIAFYEGTRRLEPDEDELEALLSPGVRALYVIHYLGFPQDAARWRRWCDERGLLLIEDAAQAWLAEVDDRPVGADGDLAIFCLYKSFGVPDGAALHLAHGMPPTPRGRAPSGIGALARRHAAWLASRSRWVTAVFERVQRSAPYDATSDFALGDADLPPTAATLRLLPRVAARDAAARRRANYRALLGALPGRVAPPFDALAPGASPFAFPLEVSDRTAALESLRREGVSASPFWSAAHPALPADRFPALLARRERTVLLPVHQELTAEGFERIVTGARATRPPERPLAPSTPVPSGG